MKKEPNCFKVVWVVNGELRSYLNSSFRIMGSFGIWGKSEGQKPTLGRIYVPGVPTYPLIGKLFVFDTIEHARNGTNVRPHSCSEYELWTAYGENLRLCKKQCDTFVMRYEKVLAFWRGEVTDTTEPTLGTLTATSVTLLEKLTDFQRRK